MAEGRELVTVRTRTRPGYPRRKPRRKYGYSDDTTNNDRAWMALSVLIVTAMFAAAVIPWQVM